MVNVKDWHSKHDEDMEKLELTMLVRQHCQGKEPVASTPTSRYYPTEMTCARDRYENIQ
jgi:hypothetical protein